MEEGRGLGGGRHAQWQASKEDPDCLRGQAPLEERPKCSSAPNSLPEHACAEHCQERLGLGLALLVQTEYPQLESGALNPMDRVSEASFRVEFSTGLPVLHCQDEHVHVAHLHAERPAHSASTLAVLPNLIMLQLTMTSYLEGGTGAQLASECLQESGLPRPWWS